MLKIQHKLDFICKFSELAYLLLVEVSKFLMAIPHKEEEGEKGKLPPPPVLSALGAALLTRSIYQLCLKAVPSPASLAVLSMRYRNRSHQLDLTNTKPLTEALLWGCALAAGFPYDTIPYSESRRLPRAGGLRAEPPVPARAGRWEQSSPQELGLG